MKKPLFYKDILVSSLLTISCISVDAQVKTKPVTPVIKPPSTTAGNIKPVQPLATGLITLTWTAPRKETVSDAPTKTFIGFKGAIYNAANSYLPEYFSQNKISRSTNQLNVTLTSATYEPLTSEELNALGASKLITSDIKINYSIVYLRKEPYAQIHFIPIRKNPSTGQYEKLVSFGLNIQQNVAPLVKRSRKKGSFAASSVLATGKWYRIGVTSEGIYKLDYNFFKNLGYDMASLQPQNIRIYGNGGAMLPINNSSQRYDDLQENAIYTTSSTSFGLNDYVLFFGQSPNTWAYDSVGKHFHHTVNLYSDTTYYFITADLGPGKRIATENSTLLTPNDTVTSFDDYQYHELDQTNLIQSGNKWFGETFDVTTSYNITFNFPNISTKDSVYINAQLASRDCGSNSYYAVTSGAASRTMNISSVSCCFFCTYAYMGATSFNTTSSSPQVTVNVSKSTIGAVGWLYFVEANVRRPLSMPNAQMEFRDARSVKAGKISQFNLSSFSAVQVWDVTDPLNVSSVSLNKTSSSNYQFTLPTDSLKQFMAFTGTTFLTPTYMGVVANQNLHADSLTDMVIVTSPLFLPQAEQLAEFHRTHDNLKVQVATTTQVYNEFSSGKQDPVAIRDFCRMFYTRSTSYANNIKYLLLYGDGSYDPKNRIAGNSNYVVAYESDQSFDPTSSYVSDDFFAVLDSGKGNLDAFNYTLNIGVGRLTVDNTSQAQIVMNKIISYETASGEPVKTTVSCCNPQTQYNMGSWRNQVCFIAHDGDADTHIQEAEEIDTMVARVYPNLNVNKIYLDAYQMVQTPGGARYPAVNEAINRQMDDGVLIINFTGHGGQLGLAVERVLTFSDIYSWTNVNKLSLFFTASCEFARYDDPNQISAGELCLLTQNGGNIALMTTVRDVYSEGNLQLNMAFYNSLYTPLPDGSLPRMGDLISQAKNDIAPFTVNSLNFTLLGDPAVRLAYPQQRVYTSTINSSPVSAYPAPADTLKALSKITITGYVGDTSGNLIPTFNGLVYPTVYDKASSIITLDNDGNSPPYNFKLQKNTLFKGKATVTNGKFSYSFVVPKDIQYNIDYGKISYYAQNGSYDATGNFENVKVGGTSSTAYNNGKGPQVKLYINDSNFVFNGMTNENPQIFAIVNDSNGINTTGNGIGHDITAVLDNNTANTIDLNDYYKPALNSYEKGTVIYPFSGLSPGKHSLSLRVWNVYNNSTQAYTEFNVEPQASLQLQHVLNYPDPFTTHTQFYFELNQVCDQLDVQIQVFTVSGKLVRNIVTSVKSDSFRSQPIDWDGRDDYGDKLANGVYIYHVKVRTSEGTTTDTYQKLVIL